MGFLLQLLFALWDLLASDSSDEAFINRVVRAVRAALLLLVAVWSRRNVPGHAKRPEAMNPVEPTITTATYCGRDRRVGLPDTRPAGALGRRAADRAVKVPSIPSPDSQGRF